MQTKLADLLGLSTQTAEEWDNGQIESSADMLLAIVFTLSNGELHGIDKQQGLSFSPSFAQLILKVKGSLLAVARHACEISMKEAASIIGVSEEEYRAFEAGPQGYDESDPIIPGQYVSDFLSQNMTLLGAESMTAEDRAACIREIYELLSTINLGPIDYLMVRVKRQRQQERETCIRELYEFLSAAPQDASNGDSPEETPVKKRETQKIRASLNSLIIAECDALLNENGEMPKEEREKRFQKLSLLLNLRKRLYRLSRGFGGRFEHEADLLTLAVAGRPVSEHPTDFETVNYPTAKAGGLKEP